MLKLARQALSAGGAAPAVFNAANEAAVQAFLDRRIGFLDIAATVAETLEKSEGGSFGGTEADPLGSALEADRSARRLAQEAVGRRALAA